MSNWKVQHWYRLWFGNDHAPSHFLIQWSQSSPMHIFSNKTFYFIYCRLRYIHRKWYTGIRNVSILIMHEYQHHRHLFKHIIALKTVSEPRRALWCLPKIRWYSTLRNHDQHMKGRNYFSCYFDIEYLFVNLWNTLSSLRLEIIEYHQGYIWWDY